jgi:hypothetical protein
LLEILSFSLGRAHLQISFKFELNECLEILVLLLFTVGKFYLLITDGKLTVIVPCSFSNIFCRDERQQLLLGIRRANRQPTNISSSVLSSDSMHIGILAAAAHAAANNSPFTIFYNPRSVL